MGDVPVGDASTAARQLGRLFADYRARSGLTQEQVAERAQLSERALRNIELGLVRKPRPRTVAALVSALEIDPAGAAAIDRCMRRIRVRKGRAGPVEPAWEDQPGWDVARLPTRRDAGSPITMDGLTPPRHPTSVDRSAALLVVPAWLAMAVVDIPDDDASALLDELISLRLVEAVDSRIDFTESARVDDLVEYATQCMESRHERASALDSARRRAVDAVLRHVDPELLPVDRRAQGRELRAS